MKKNSNLKKIIKNFKEMWSIPRYRAIIKLSLYGIMFLILFILANIYNDTNTLKNETTEQKSFTDIINASDFTNLNFEYNIKISDIEHNIEGKIQNNILTGYYENNNYIKKIKLADNIFYSIINEEEIIDEELNNLFISEFLLPNNIIELVNNETAYIEKNDDYTIYTYNILYNQINYEIKLLSNLKEINNIFIKGNNIEYSLNVIFDKSE